jgi:hypothetical protein
MSTDGAVFGFLAVVLIIAALVIGGGIGYLFMRYG